MASFLLLKEEYTMALRISKNAGLSDVVTDSNRIETQHPTTGAAQDVSLWLFNDDATRRYENINIDPMDLTGGDESSYVQLAPDNAGSPGTFLSASAALSMANISTANSGVRFWARVTTPNGLAVQNKTDIFLRVNFREFAV